MFLIATGSIYFSFAYGMREATGSRMTGCRRSTLWSAGRPRPARGISAGAGRAGTPGAPLGVGTHRISRSLSSDLHHRPRGWHESRFPAIVPCFFLLHHLPNELRELLARRAAPHQLGSLVIRHRTHTGTHHPVRHD